MKLKLFLLFCTLLSHCNAAILVDIVRVSDNNLRVQFSGTFTGSTPSSSDQLYVTLGETSQTRYVISATAISGSITIDGTTIGSAIMLFNGASARFPSDAASQDTLFFNLPNGTPAIDNLYTAGHAITGSYDLEWDSGHNITVAQLETAELWWGGLGSGEAVKQSDISYSIGSVPEPSSIILMGGAALFTCFGRRRRK